MPIAADPLGRLFCVLKASAAMRNVSLKAWSTRLQQRGTAKKPAPAPSLPVLVARTLGMRPMSRSTAVCAVTAAPAGGQCSGLITGMPTYLGALTQASVGASRPHAFVAVLATAAHRQQVNFFRFPGLKWLHLLKETA